MKVPDIAFPPVNKYVQKAMSYVEKHFPSNPGTTDNFFYPVTYEAARKWYRDFPEHRFEYFGDYQDAIQSDQSFLFHPVISPSLNIGLLTPQEIVNEAVSFAETHNVNMNSLMEVFIDAYDWIMVPNVYD